MRESTSDIGSSVPRSPGRDPKRSPLLRSSPTAPLPLQLTSARIGKARQMRTRKHERAKTRKGQRRTGNAKLNKEARKAGDRVLSLPAFLASLLSFRSFLFRFPF